MVTNGSAHRTEDGVELAYWSLPGSSPELLLVHGLASNARLWDGVASRLERRGHGVVALDQRGHGLSAKPASGFDWARLAADLAGLIEAVMQPPVVAVGQSFGGNLVIETAVRFPELVSGVVCVDGGFVDLRGAWPDWDEAKLLLSPPSLDDLHAHDLAARAEEMYPGWPAEGIAGQLANLEVSAEGRVSRRLPLDSHLAILRTMWEQSPVEVAAKVTQPVLVLAALAGPLKHQEQVQRFVDALRRGRTVWVDGHHDLHAEQPETVAAEIERALADGFLR